MCRSALSDVIGERLRWLGILDWVRLSPKFASCKSRISRSGGAFCGLALVVYWTRCRLEPSSANALSWSGVGLAERVIVALGA